MSQGQSETNARKINALSYEQFLGAKLRQESLFTASTEHLVTNTQKLCNFKHMFFLYNVVASNVICKNKKKKVWLAPMNSQE